MPVGRDRARRHRQFAIIASVRAKIERQDPQHTSRVVYSCLRRAFFICLFFALLKHSFGFSVKRKQLLAFSIGDKAGFWNFQRLRHRKKLYNQEMPLSRLIPWFWLAVEP